MEKLVSETSCEKWENFDRRSTCNHVADRRRLGGGWYRRIKSEKADELFAWSHEDRSGESRSGGAGRPGTL